MVILSVPGGTRLPTYFISLNYSEMCLFSFLDSARLVHLVFLLMVLSNIFAWCAVADCHEF